MDNQHNTDYFIDCWHKQFCLVEKISKINKMAIFAIRTSITRLFNNCDVHFERSSTNYHKIFIYASDEEDEDAKPPIIFTLRLFDEINISKSINQKPLNHESSNILPATEYFSFAELEDSLSNKSCLLKIYANELNKGSKEDLYFFSAMQSMEYSQLEIKITDMITNQIYDFLNGITPSQGKIESPEVLNVSALLDEIQL